MKKQLCVFTLAVSCLYSIPLCGSVSDSISLIYFHTAAEKYSHQDYEGAIADYTKVINLKPAGSTVFDAYHYRGKAKFDLELYEEAAADYTKAINIKSDYPDYYYGEVYYDRGETRVCFLGQKKEGRADIVKAIELGYSHGLGVLDLCK